jgi:hypothetical protein
MSTTVIMWQPIMPAGENLNCSNADMFVLQMSTAFPGQVWPILLTAKDVPVLNGMAAATTIVGNPYLKLAELLRKYPKIEVRQEHGEGAF